MTKTLKNTNKAKLIAYVLAVCSLPLLALPLPIINSHRATFHGGTAIQAASRHSLLPPTQTKHERAFKLLENAVLESKAVESREAASILFLVGHVFTVQKRSYGSQFLEAAYEIIRHDVDPSPSLYALKREIVSDTASLLPDLVEEALPTDNGLRDSALLRLVEHSVKKKKFEHAIELAALMSSEPDAYIAAKQIIKALPKTEADLKALTFSHALMIYRRTTHPLITAVYPEDLGSLVSVYWRELPPVLVLEAIEEVLKAADPERAPANSQIRTASLVANEKNGVVLFQSYYQLRVFQFLPILRKLDPPKADLLQKDNSEVTSLLERYPGGQESLASGDEPVHLSLRLTSANVGLPARDRESTQIDFQRPADAVSNAILITSPLVRARTLMTIAQAATPGHVDIAAEALDALLKIDDEKIGANLWNQAAAISIKLQLTDRARRFVQLAAAASQREYTNEVKSDHPNSAIKLFWGPTASWRDTVANAAQISDQIALDIIGNIPSPEIRALEEIMLAGIWLDVPVWKSYSPMREEKPH